MKHQIIICKLLRVVIMKDRGEEEWKHAIDAREVCWQNKLIVSVSEHAATRVERRNGKL